MLRDYGNTLAKSSTSQKGMLQLTDKCITVVDEYDAEVMTIEEKLKAEKVALEIWRNSQTLFHGVTQIALFAAENTSAALIVA